MKTETKIEKKAEPKEAPKAAKNTGATSKPEQLGEKAPGVDPSSQANNQGETKVNDGSAAGGYNTIEE